MMIPTARKLEKYIVKLVQKAPEWIQVLFDDQRVFFCINDESQLELQVANDMPKGVEADLQKYIADYLEEHPAPFIQTKELVH